MLYEIAFAFGALTRPFSIYSLRPRIKVPLFGSITDVGDPPLVLVVEECDDGHTIADLSDQEQVTKLS